MYLHHAHRDGSRVFYSSGGTAAYGERVFTKYKYKNYERVIEIMES